MQVKKTLSGDEATVTITSHEADLEPIKQHVLGHLRSSVKVAGFREGKVPLSLVEKNVDDAKLQSEFLDEAINHLYVSAANQLGLKPISQPEVSIKKFVPFTALEFEVKVEVIGEVSLPNYKQMKKVRPKVTITAKDVSEVLSSLLLRAAQKEEVNRAAKTGDEVLLDFVGKDAKGESVNGAEGKDYPLLLGSNTFIPGFEPNLLGLKPGEEKTFDLTFPKDYGVPAIAGKKVTFTVKIKKVQAVIEPKLDDNFATKVGPFKNLPELEADIKKQLAVERQTEADRQFENELVLDISRKSKLSVPARLIDEQVERLEQEERQNLTYRGQTWQEHLSEEGLSEDEHRTQKRPQAEERVKAGLVLSAVAEAEKLGVTPEELEVRIQLLKGQYKDATMQLELDKPENRRDIASRLLTEKTIIKLREYATKK